MSEPFWEDELWAFINSEDSAKTTDEIPGLNLSEPTNTNCLTPQTAEPEPSAAGGSKKRSKNAGEGSGQKGKKKSVGEKGKKKGDGEESGEEKLHIKTERERRKKMRSLFDDLHALLPHLPPKADKSTVVDEAASQIKTLEQTLQKLQRQKLEKLHGGMGKSNLNPSSLAIPRTRAPLISREAFLADQGSANQSSIIPISQQLNPSPPFPRFPSLFRTWLTQNVVLSVTGDNAHINICCGKKFGLYYHICDILERHNVEVVTLQVLSDHYRSMFFIHARASVTLQQMSDEILSFEDIFQRAAGEIKTYIESLGSPSNHYR